MNKIVQFQMWLTWVEVREGKITIQGYASTPSIDRYNSIVEVEAIQNGLENYEKNPVLLLGHDSAKPIGTVTDWSIDKKGWKVTADITKDTDGVMSDVTEWRTKWFSIGFIPLARHYIDRATSKLLSEMTQEEQEAMDYQNIVRVITAVDIVELSVVNVPANAQSLFTISKALRAFFTELETRQIAERYLVKDNENPFTSKIDNETEETTAEATTETDETDENTEETAETSDTNESNDDTAVETTITPPSEDKTTEWTEETNKTDWSEGSKEQPTNIEETEGEGKEIDDNEVKGDIKEEDTTTTNETIEEIDIAIEDSQDDEGSDGENPDTATAETQASEKTIEELQFELSEERSFNDKTIDDLIWRVSELQAKLDKRAVNKPIVTTHNNLKEQKAQGEPFVEMLKGLKNGI